MLFYTIHIPVAKKLRLINGSRYLDIAAKSGKKAFAPPQPIIKKHCNDLQCFFVVTTAEKKLSFGHKFGHIKKQLGRSIFYLFNPSLRWDRIDNNLLI